MLESKGAVSKMQVARRSLLLGMVTSAIVYGFAGALYTASIIDWIGLLTFALALGGIGGGIAGAIGGAVGGWIALGLANESDEDHGRVLAQGVFAAAAVAFGIELAMATSYSGSIVFALKFAAAGLFAAAIASSAWYLIRRWRNSELG